MKRAGSDGLRRSTPPRSPSRPDDDTASFDDSSEEPELGLEQALARASDPSRSGVEREAWVRSCIAGLPPGQGSGIFCLDAEHWQLLEAITLLDAPQEASELFVASYLGRPGAPLAPAQCLDAVNRVKAARAALAALALHATPFGCSTAALRTLEIATTFNGCPLACRNLLEFAFRGHEALVADVYASLCEALRKGPRPSAWACVVALASMHDVPGGGALDAMQGAASVCAANESLGALVVGVLVQYRAILQSTKTLQCAAHLELIAELGAIRETIGGLEQLMDACPEDASGREIREMISGLQQWAGAVLHSKA